jgi:hypothetical protein
MYSYDRRKLAGRAIKIDTRALSALAEQLLDEAIETLTKRQELSEPIGTHEDLAVGEWEGQRARGGVVIVRVSIGSRPANTLKRVAGGHFQEGTERRLPRIVLYLNGGWDLSELVDNKYEFLRPLASNLFHEATHAADVIPEGDLHGSDAPAEDYYNQPVEVRAYGRQVLQEVLTHLKVHRSTLRGKPVELTGPLIEKLLAKSERWREIEPHLTRQSQAVIRRMIARELEEFLKPAV